MQKVTIIDYGKDNGYFRYVVTVKTGKTYEDDPKPQGFNTPEEALDYISAALIDKKEMRQAA